MRQTVAVHRLCCTYCWIRAINGVPAVNPGCSLGSRHVSSPPSRGVPQLFEEATGYHIEESSGRRSPRLPKSGQQRCSKHPSGCELARARHILSLQSPGEEWLHHTVEVGLHRVLLHSAQTLYSAALYGSCVNCISSFWLQASPS